MFTQEEATMMATMTAKEIVEFVNNKKALALVEAENAFEAVVRSAAATLNSSLSSFIEEHPMGKQLSGVLTISILQGKIEVSYTEKKVRSVSTPKGVSSKAIHKHRDNPAKLAELDMYYNYKGNTVSIRYDADTKEWFLPDYEITAQSPSTLLKLYASEVYGEKLEANGWYVIKINEEDNV